MEKETTGVALYVIHVENRSLNGTSSATRSPGATAVVRVGLLVAATIVIGSAPLVTRCFVPGEGPVADVARTPKLSPRAL